MNSITANDAGLPANKQVKSAKRSRSVYVDPVDALTASVSTLSITDSSVTVTPMPDNPIDVKNIKDAKVAKCKYGFNCKNKDTTKCNRDHGEPLETNSTNARNTKVVEQRASGQLEKKANAVKITAAAQELINLRKEARDLKEKKFLLEEIARLKTTSHGVTLSSAAQVSTVLSSAQAPVLKEKVKPVYTTVIDPHEVGPQTDKAIESLNAIAEYESADKIKAALSSYMADVNSKCYISTKDKQEPFSWHVSFAFFTVYPDLHRKLFPDSKTPSKPFHNPKPSG